MSAVITLDQIPVGETVLVCEISVDGDGAARLMEMGVTAGTRVRIARIAPLGDPIDIVVRGYHLSLRKAEARCIRVTHVGIDGDAS